MLKPETCLYSFWFQICRLKHNFRERHGASKLYTFVRRVGKKAGPMYKRIGCSTATETPVFILHLLKHVIVPRNVTTWKSHTSLISAFLIGLPPKYLLRLYYYHYYHYSEYISCTFFYSHVSTASLPLVGERHSVFGQPEFSSKAEALLQLHQRHQRRPECQPSITAIRRNTISLRLLENVFSLALLFTFASSSFQWPKKEL